MTAGLTRRFSTTSRAPNLVRRPARGRHRLRRRDAVPSRSPSTFSFQSSTTDATHDIRLTVDPGNHHDGVAGAGVIVDANLGGTRSTSGIPTSPSSGWSSSGPGATTSPPIQVYGTDGDLSTNVVLQNLLIHNFGDKVAGGLQLRHRPRGQQHPRGQEHDRPQHDDLGRRRARDRRRRGPGHGAHRERLRGRDGLPRHLRVRQPLHCPEHHRGGQSQCGFPSRVGKPVGNQQHLDRHQRRELQRTRSARRRRPPTSRRTSTSTCGREPTRRWTPPST